MKFSFTLCTLHYYSHTPYAHVIGVNLSLVWLFSETPDTWNGRLMTVSGISDWENDLLAILYITSAFYLCGTWWNELTSRTRVRFFSPAKIEWNGIQLLLSQRRVFLSFSFFLMRIWVLCKLCHNEISCTFHHVALCWRIKQMVNWFSGNCSKIKKTGNHCFSVTLLDKITQTKHYLKCYYKSAVYYFISISF